MVFSSQLGLPDLMSSDLAQEICRNLKAEEYISGPSGENYLDIYSFKKNGIEIIPQNFTIPSGIGMPEGPEALFSSLHHVICQGLEKSKTLIKEICA